MQHKVSNLVYLALGITLLVLLVTFMPIGFTHAADRNGESQAALKQGLQEAEKHRWGKALQHFEQAIKLNPKNGQAWANHGTALLNLGNPKKALKSYQRAKVLSPKDPYVYCSLASAHNDLGEYKAAIRQAEQALAIDPRFAPAMANKAKALAHLGKQEASQ